MRICFIVIGNSRRSNYLNGDTIRYGKGGGSGTDGSSILVAEYLSAIGHEVVIVTEELEPQLVELYDPFEYGKVIRGVQYTNKDFVGIDNLEFDVLVNSLWFNDYNSLPIRVTKSLIYWCHMQWIYGIDEMLDYVRENNLDLNFVNISQWERSMTEETIFSASRRYGRVNSVMIPNPIMDEMITEVLLDPPTRKKHKFSFHAVWARGGNVAVEAVRELNLHSPEFHAFDYLMATHDHGDSFFVKHDGVDKKTLFTHLAESDYFIYPLYTPYEDVHKDTFACVVAEAIALGVIVITYPLGALKEFYDGYCRWVDFPEGFDVQQAQSEPLTKDYEGKFKNTNNIVKAINEIESDPEFKESIRNLGKKYIMENFSIAVVGKKWESLLNSLG